MLQSVILVRKEKQNRLVSCSTSEQRLKVKRQSVQWTGLSLLTIYFGMRSKADASCYYEATVPSPHISCTIHVPSNNSLQQQTAAILPPSKSPWWDCRSLLCPHAIQKSAAKPQSIEAKGRPLQTKPEDQNLLGDALPSTWKVMLKSFQNILPHQHSLLRPRPPWPASATSLSSSSSASSYPPPHLPFLFLPHPPPPPPSSSSSSLLPPPPPPPHHHHHLLHHHHHQCHASLV